MSNNCKTCLQSMPINCPLTGPSWKRCYPTTHRWMRDASCKPCDRFSPCWIKFFCLSVLLLWMSDSNGNVMCWRGLWVFVCGKKLLINFHGEKRKLSRGGRMKWMWPVARVLLHLELGHLRYLVRFPLGMIDTRNVLKRWAGKMKWWSWLLTLEMKLM